VNPDIIKRFDEVRERLLSDFTDNPPSQYVDVVKTLVRVLSCDSLPMDYKRIKCVDWGDYQGTKVFVIGATGYQPSTHWSTQCNYGSCSGCDTLQNIQDGSVKDKAKDYVTLALHLAQKMKEI
jgi:hypothetical protein